MSATKRIALWSGPRNISTAMMYSFAQRPDTQVVDEPLFGYFLKHTGVERPSREEALRAMETDASIIINEDLLAEKQAPIYFMKHIANHLTGLDWSFVKNFSNVILIRHPKEMLTSFIKQVDDPTMLDTAYEIQVELFDHLLAKNLKPIVVDSKQILLDPPTVLEKLCKSLGIEFYEEMLKWPAGPITEDGVWAKYWYHSVHQSTGFAPYKEKDEEVPTQLEAFYENCLGHYTKLYQHILQ